VEYLVESGLSTQDARRIADSWRAGHADCVKILLSAVAGDADTLEQESFDQRLDDQRMCTRNVYQEHGLSEAMRWLARKLNWDKLDDR